MNLRKIFLLTKVQRAPKNKFFSLHLNTKAFTLIEILIVLSIIAAVLALSIPRIQKRENNIRSVARQMSVMAKEIRNHARLTNSTMRLALDLGEKEPKYWVEKSAGVELRLAKEDEKLDEEKKPKSSFQLFKTLTKKEKDLPPCLFFKSVEVLNYEPVTEGVGYIYFSPEGFVDFSAIQITDKKKLIWTLVFNPLTGQVDTLTEGKELKDLKSE